MILSFLFTLFLIANVSNSSDYCNKPKVFESFPANELKLSVNDIPYNEQNIKCNKLNKKRNRINNNCVNQILEINNNHNSTIFLNNENCDLVKKKQKIFKSISNSEFIKQNIKIKNNFNSQVNLINSNKIEITSQKYNIKVYKNIQDPTQYNIEEYDEAEMVCGYPKKYAIDGYDLSVSNEQLNILFHYYPSLKKLRCGILTPNPYNRLYSLKRYENDIYNYSKFNE